MRFRVGAATVCALFFSLSTSAQEPGEILMLNVRMASGQHRAGTQVRDQPYEAAGSRPRAGVFFTDQNKRNITVRDRDGDVATGLGFYAWRQSNYDAPVQVRVFLLSPEAAASAMRRSGQWRPKDFASYTMKKGQTLRVDEMKSLGLEPFVLSVEPSKPQPKQQP